MRIVETLHIQNRNKFHESIMNKYQLGGRNFEKGATLLYKIEQSGLLLSIQLSQLVNLLNDVYYIQQGGLSHLMTVENYKTSMNQEFKTMMQAIENNQFNYSSASLAFFKKVDNIFKLSVDDLKQKSTRLLQDTLNLSSIHQSNKRMTKGFWMSDYLWMNKIRVEFQNTLTQTILKHQLQLSETSNNLDHLTLQEKVFREKLDAISHFHTKQVIEGYYQDLLKVWDQHVDTKVLNQGYNLSHEDYRVGYHQIIKYLVVHETFKTNSLKGCDGYLASLHHELSKLSQILEQEGQLDYRQVLSLTQDYEAIENNVALVETLIHESYNWLTQKIEESIQDEKLAYGLKPVVEHYKASVLDKSYKHILKHFEDETVHTHDTLKKGVEAMTYRIHKLKKTVQENVENTSNYLAKAVNYQENILVKNDILQDLHKVLKHLITDSESRMNQINRVNRSATAIDQSITHTLEALVHIINNQWEDKVSFLTQIKKIQQMKAIESAIESNAFSQTHIYNRSPINKFLENYHQDYLSDLKSKWHHVIDAVYDSFTKEVWTHLINNHNVTDIANIANHKNIENHENISNHEIIENIQNVYLDKAYSQEEVEALTTLVVLLEEDHRRLRFLSNQGLVKEEIIEELSQHRILNQVSDETLIRGLSEYEYRSLSKALEVFNTRKSITNEETYEVVSSQIQKKFKAYIENLRDRVSLSKDKGALTKTHLILEGLLRSKKGNISEWIQSQRDVELSTAIRELFSGLSQTVNQNFLLTEDFIEVFRQLKAIEGAIRPKLYEGQDIGYYTSAIADKWNHLVGHVYDTLEYEALNRVLIDKSYTKQEEAILMTIHEVIKSHYGQLSRVIQDHFMIKKIMEAVHVTSNHRDVSNDTIRHLINEYEGVETILHEKMLTILPSQLDLEVIRSHPMRQDLPGHMGKNIEGQTTRIIDMTNMMEMVEIIDMTLLDKKWFADYLSAYSEARVKFNIQTEVVKETSKIMEQVMYSYEDALIQDFDNRHHNYELTTEKNFFRQLMYKKTSDLEVVKRVQETFLVEGQMEYRDDPQVDLILLDKNTNQVKDNLDNLGHLEDFIDIEQVIERKEGQVHKASSLKQMQKHQVEALGKIERRQEALEKQLASKSIENLYRQVYKRIEKELITEKRRRGV